MKVRVAAAVLVVAALLAPADASAQTFCYRPVAEGPLVDLAGRPCGAARPRLVEPTIVPPVVIEPTVVEQTVIAPAPPPEASYVAPYWPYEAPAVIILVPRRTPRAMPVEKRPVQQPLAAQSGFVSVPPLAPARR
jgi:hypothetical protein